jgi:hypothetical protein
MYEVGGCNSALLRSHSMRVTPGIYIEVPLYASLFLAGKDFDLKVMPHVMFLCIA